MKINLSEKTYFLITGASRGIGQTMALRVAEKLGENSVIILLARNQDGLIQTKNQIDALNRKLQVQTFSIDLSKAISEDFRQLLRTSLQSNSEKIANFKRAFIIHNAETIGDVSKRAIENSNTSIWTEYYHTNLFSVISLNCEFFQVFGNIPKLVVNISSKAAIEPFKSMSFYCSGKAAREMYFRILAAEEANDTIVLNYAPGAIETQMSLDIQNQTINKELSKIFKDRRDNKSMQTIEQTTANFLKILEEQNFKSGDHVV